MDSFTNKPGSTVISTTTTLPAISNLNYWFDYENVVVGALPPRIAAPVDFSPRASLNVATTTGLAGQPFISPNNLNGKKLIRFNTSASIRMTNTSLTYFSPTAPFSYAMVGRVLNRLPDYVNHFVTIATIRGAASNSFTIFYYTTGSRMTVYLNYSTSGSPTAPTVGNPAFTCDIEDEYTNFHSLVVTYNGLGVSNPANYSIIVNGVSKTVSSEATSGVISNTNAWPNSGTPSVGINPVFDGATNIMWNKQLTPLELGQLNAYFKNKYNVGL